MALGKMAREIGLSDKRSAPGDLEIRFEANGAPFAFFIPESMLKGQKKSDVMAAIQNQMACAICCSQKASFALCMARCLDDGKCCDGGATNCD